MRILVRPRNGDSFDKTIRYVVEILHSADILSARPGGTINDQAVILIEPEDFANAFATLKSAGVPLIMSDVMIH